jgi:Fusaric acid resistance protein-like
MTPPVLPSKGRTISGALRANTRVPLLWQLAITAFAAAGLAGWLAWEAGYQPPVEARWIEAHAALGQHAGFDYQLFVIAKVLPAALVALFVVIAAAAVPRKRSLPATVISGVVVMVTIFLAWGTIGSPWAIGPVMALVIALGPLARRHGGAIAGLAPIIAVAYFFFAVWGLAKGLDPVGIFVQAGIGVGAAAAVLIALWAVRVTLGLEFIKHPPQRTREGTPPPFLSGGLAMRQALVAGALVGAAAGLYAATRDHNVFWAMVSIWAVMQATPDASFNRGIKRGCGVMAGCVLIAGIAQVASPQVVVWIGVGTLFLGVMWYLRNYAVYIAGISMLTVALHGNLEDLDFIHWALLRVGDTLVGLAIGFAAYWLVVSLPEEKKARREGIART